ncbi:sensor histidine kinase [Ferruginibacter sp.]
MKHPATISFLLLFFLLPAIAVAQLSGKYRAQTFGTRNGLFSSKVYALAQSSDRRLWIGTELGVSIYNGYDFINYQYTGASESIGRVLCITQDSTGAVWIGGDKGLFYYQQGIIKRVTLESKKAIAAEALHTDGNGNLWVGCIDALYKIPASITNSFSSNNYSTIALTPFAGFTRRVFCIASDKKQQIYIGSHDGLFKTNADASHYESIWANPDPVNFVHAVAVIAPDSIFWNCLNHHPMQLVQGKISGYYTDEFIGNTVFSSGSEIYALTTSGIGLINNSKVQTLFNFETITNNAFTALKDAEGNFWIGSWEGLQKFQANNFRQYSLQQSEHKEVFSFWERKNGDLLFGGNRGTVFIKNQEAIIPEKNIPAVFPQSEVMCIHEDASGGLWFGSGYEGISRFKDNRLTHWKDTGFLKDNNCEALFDAGSDGLLACTEHGVTRIDPLLNDPLTAHYNFEKNYTRYPELFGCYKAADGKYFFYGSTGLFVLKNNLLVEDAVAGMPVKNLYVTKIAADKKGNVWIATLGKGLLQCVYQDGHFILKQQYDTKKGAPSDIALTVLTDKNDNVWWGDYMSISVLLNAGSTEQLISFNEKDGLLSSYYQTLKLEQQRNGTIWALTSMGMVSFHPDSISQNTIAPVLALDSITMTGSDSNYTAAVTPVFDHNQNSLQFCFTAVCLTDASRVRYAYRLIGMDSNWVYTSSRSINFNFLQPGKYSFEVKACNNNNVWTKNSLQYSFTILPPFWKTWWFRVIMIAAVAALVFILFRRRLAVIKNRISTKQQMAELEAKAIRAQMNPHFIFNSLNAIQELIITRNTEEGYRYLSSFSKLLRMVLNNSDKNFIPLSNELEMIKLYLSLESLRFRQSFSYEILLDENIEPEITQVPSLLLQPYVENAVWHGLRHHDGEKKLLITIHEKQQQLQIAIDDNGVGRKRSETIKSQKLGAEQFESKGTALAEQRIAVLNSQYPGMAKITIVDKTDDEGNATGTKVLIYLPVNIKN